MTRIERIDVQLVDLEPATVRVDAMQSFVKQETVLVTVHTRTYEPLGIAWFEEPLPADDMHGHERLAAATSVPVAVGESLYSVQRFGDYLAAGAVGIVQVDVARIGGIAPWLKVAHAPRRSTSR